MSPQGIGLWQIVDNFLILAGFLAVYSGFRLNRAQMLAGEGSRTVGARSFPPKLDGYERKFCPGMLRPYQYLWFTNPKNAVKLLFQLYDQVTIPEAVYRRRTEKPERHKDHKEKMALCSSCRKW